MKLSWRFSFVSMPLLSLLIPNMGYSQCQTQSSAASLPELNPPTSEVALANMIIYSQEYMRYFFSDNESEIQPLPASGLALFTGYGLSGSSRWLNALSLPLREEEVKKKNGDTFQYYYPKIFMTCYEIDALERPFFFKRNMPPSQCLCGNFTISQSARIEGHSTLSPHTHFSENCPKCRSEFWNRLFGKYQNGCMVLPFWGFVSA